MLPAGTIDPNPDNTATANGANFTEGTSPDDFDNTTAASTGNATDAISNGEDNTTAAGNDTNTGSDGNANTAIPASPAPTTDVIGGGNVTGTDSGAGQLTGTVDPIPGTGGIGIAGPLHVHDMSPAASV